MMFSETGDTKGATADAAMASTVTDRLICAGTDSESGTHKPMLLLGCAVVTDISWVLNGCRIGYYWRILS